ncbi:MAG TPA: hypothetical protein VD793_10960 [Gemmatimonadales bacterium]|nr:hypothetical protein [Gemmatimonadales bacterium]
MTMRISLSHRRTVPALAAASLVAALGCASLLEVENPEELPIGDLNQPSQALISALINGVIGDFTHMYDDPFIWRGSMFTDEQVTGVNWEQTARLNLRIVQYNEGDADLMFSEISKALRQAEDVYDRLLVLFPSPAVGRNPASDPDIARVLNFAGYSYVAMGEAMCEAVVSKIDPTTGEIAFGEYLLSPDSLFLRAISRFQQALTVATAAMDANLQNMARVGMARAALGVGQNATVIAQAGAVPAAFKWWLDYSDATGRENNNQFTNINGANHRLGMAPKFLQSAGQPFGTQRLVASQTDPRIQSDTNWTTGHNALTKLYKIRQGLRFDGYNGNRWGSVPRTTPAAYSRGTDILLADGIEAQHHLYEATGPSAATSAFIDARRAVGFQSAMNFAAGDPAMMAELREQRARDLFQGGFRLGDLRRWKKNGVGDFFPTGQHVNYPAPAWLSYSDATCYPLPLEEYDGNPFIRDLKPN